MKKFVLYFIGISFLLNCKDLSAQSKVINISMDLSFARDSLLQQDSFWLATYPFVVRDYREQEGQLIKGEKISANKFSFSLPYDSKTPAFYFSIFTYDAKRIKRVILDKYLLSSGADFFISFLQAPGIWPSLSHEKFIRQFTGLATDELTCQEMLNIASLFTGGSPLETYEGARVSSMQKILNGYRSYLKPEVYSILALDIIGKYRTKSFDVMIVRWLPRNH